nr:hypothetical protein CFP56_64721 [Quercus suber]
MNKVACCNEDHLEHCDSSIAERDPCLQEHRTIRHVDSELSKKNNRATRNEGAWNIAIRLLRSESWVCRKIAGVRALRKTWIQLTRLKHSQESSERYEFGQRTTILSTATSIKMKFAFTISTIACMSALTSAWDIDFYGSQGCSGDPISSASGTGSSCLTPPSGTAYAILQDGAAVQCTDDQCQDSTGEPFDIGKCRTILPGYFDREKSQVIEVLQFLSSKHMNNPEACDYFRPFASISSCSEDTWCAGQVNSSLQDSGCAIRGICQSIQLVIYDHEILSYHQHLGVHVGPQHSIGHRLLHLLRQRFGLRCKSGYIESRPVVALPPSRTDRVKEETTDQGLQDQRDLRHSRTSGSHRAWGVGGRPSSPAHQHLNLLSLRMLRPSAILASEMGIRTCGLFENSCQAPQNVLRYVVSFACNVFVDGMSLKAALDASNNDEDEIVKMYDSQENTSAGAFSRREEAEIDTWLMIEVYVKHTTGEGRNMAVRTYWQTVSVNQSWSATTV